MENNATTGKCVLSISAEFHRPVPTSQEFLQGLHRSLHEQWEAWRCTWMGSVGGRGLWDLCKTHRIAFIDVRLQFRPNPPISSAELFLQMFPLNLVVVLADGDREALERNNADRQVSVPKQIRQTIRPYFVSLSEGPSLGPSIKVLQQKNAAHPERWGMYLDKTEESLRMEMGGREEYIEGLKEKRPAASSSVQLGVIRFQVQCRGRSELGSEEAVRERVIQLCSSAFQLAAKGGQVMEGQPFQLDGEKVRASLPLPASSSSSSCFFYCLILLLI
uniref:Uncharacterized protein n=1 Tax=Chromera velia CCMP2878 TaxID=1169474 RepID=A0A0G4I7I6_9ALVE|eukprot:Cvel_11671.t1-p1 / transcript=Cvel_11671.t1 / gene=Cvel_11671 / organism=Chromera_velia_CCMP2878 / gene_product=hypothetical protein / transcript_product=hypothetical protein / location=Cvel_scaffold740:5426-6247(-) / protein_length=274 / sequence_SO=supercontig / SO=protein_coding / is_pseudo=false